MGRQEFVFFWLFDANKLGENGTFVPKDPQAFLFSGDAWKQFQKHIRTTWRLRRDVKIQLHGGK